MQRLICTIFLILAVEGQSTDTAINTTGTGARLFPGPYPWAHMADYPSYPDMALIEAAAERFFQGKQNESWYLNQVAGVLGNYSGYYAREEHYAGFYFNNQNLLWRTSQSSGVMSCSSDEQSNQLCEPDLFTRFRHLKQAIDDAIFLTFAKREGHWVVYTQEWVTSSLPDTSFDAFSESLAYLYHLAWIDGYFARQQQSLRGYARHYFIRSNSELCTSFHHVNAINVPVRGLLKVTDYDVDVAKGVLRKQTTEPTLKPGQSCTYIRCFHAEHQGGEIYQVETLLSEQAWSHHHQTTDKQEIAHWIREKLQSQNEGIMKSN